MRALIRALPTLMLFLVGSTSFLLSYVALRDVAAETQAVPAYLAWAVPVCVDGGILAASGAIWSASVKGHRRDPLAFVTVAVLLATSVVINVNHAGPDILAKWIAALPPLTLLACLEMVASQHRREVIAARTVGEDSHPVNTPAAAPASIPATAANEERGSLTSPAQPADTSSRGQAPHAPVAPRLSPEPPRPRPAPAPMVPTPPTTAPTAPPAVAQEPAAAQRPTTEPPPERAVAPARPSGARPRRVAAAAPSVGGDEDAAQFGPVESSGDSGADARSEILSRFDAHLAEGGAPDDREIAGRLAAQVGVSVPYVRRVIKPVRERLLADV